MIKLRNCQYCGNKPELINEYVTNAKYVKCPVCKARTKSSDNETEVSVAWNNGLFYLNGETLPYKHFHLLETIADNLMTYGD